MMNKLCVVAGLVGLSLVGAVCPSILQAQSWDSPFSSLPAETQSRLKDAIDTAISEGKMPGAVVCVGRSTGPIHLQAYGNKRIEPTPLPMTLDTLFDMASITKPVATGSCIVKLLEQGKLRLNEKVVDILPEFGKKGKEELTVLDLLVHRSGLIPDNPLADYLNGPESAWEKICDLPLTAPIGTTFKYSDVNFIVLGKIVEKRSGQSLDAFARAMIFDPTGMTESGFLPSEELRQRAAPTEQRDGKWIQGEVHDPRAFELGGIAGHAGLFSTVRDIGLYSQMVLNHGKRTASNGSSVQVFAKRSIELMGRGVPVTGGVRGLAWDKRTGFSVNKGDFLSDDAFGHGGFTGTVLWIDPAQNLYFVFLSNRVHPNGKGLVNPLAGRLWNMVVSGLQDSTSVDSRSQVLSGLDVLERDGFRPLKNQRVGLIANHTSRTLNGTGSPKLLAESELVDLRVLFSPEHGFEGKLDISKVGDSQDNATGLKIYSLYGETRKPTAEMLADIDTLVFDIQDIGTRFYTYVSTMGEAMKAASEHKKKFVVLDRPNPINGVDVCGPMLDAKSESFVAFHSLPVRHGMTVGELAKMFREELKLADLELLVVPCEGWKRHDYWDRTGMVWINPSPNMRSAKQALLYPGIGLLETTNISVGRGTDTPFEWIGAPWINHMELARWLNELELPGIAFAPVEFTPESSKYANQLCKGIQMEVVDRSKLDPIRVGLMIAIGLRTLYPNEWETKNLNRLLGCKEMENAILQQQSWDQLREIATRGQREFLLRRQPFLIYP